jgi:hypothetical protein
MDASNTNSSLSCDQEFTELLPTVHWMATKSLLNCYRQFSELLSTVQWTAIDSSLSCDQEFTELRPGVHWTATRSSLNCDQEFTELLPRVQSSSVNSYSDSSLNCYWQFTELIILTVHWTVFTTIIELLWRPLAYANFILCTCTSVLLQLSAWIRQPINVSVLITKLESTPFMEKHLFIKSAICW